MAKLISQITPADLDYIADCFIDDAPQYANFETFWGALLSEDPTIETIAELFLELHQLGYAVETHMGLFPSQHYEQNTDPG